MPMVRESRRVRRYFRCFMVDGGNDYDAKVRNAFLFCKKEIDSLRRETKKATHTRVAFYIAFSGRNTFTSPL